MKYSRKKQFMIVLAAFLILGIPFKVMVLIEGFTEVRPVNALPPLAGLICGPAGAFACAVGNLIADLTGTFNGTSLLGFVGNFVAAYLPYRLWYIHSDEEPNLHKNRNILIYIYICFSSAVTVAWILGFGLYYFFGQWIENIYTYVFCNEMGFSIGLGMPLFIMLTSDEIHMKCTDGPGKYRLLKQKTARCIVSVIYTVIMSIMLVSIFLHCSPQQNVWLLILSVIGGISLILILV